MSGTITDISPAYIEPSPDNPRREIGDVTELAQSIASVGVIEPLVVRPIGKKGGHEHYQVIVGHRRLAAAKATGSMWVPCIVREYPEDQRAEIMLIENLQRVDLAPLEEATAFQRLVDEFGWSQDKLAERIGRSQSHVSKRLALLQLTPKARKVLDSGGMTVGDALELAKLADAPKLMDDALARTDQWTPISRVVAAAVEEREHERKLAAAIEAAEADPAPYLPAVAGQYRGDWRPPKGARALSSKDEGFSPLGIQPAKHRKEPCHAVTVIPAWYGAGPKLMYLCTDPKRHPEGKESPQRQQLSAREVKEREETAALARAAKVRRSFVGTLPGKIERNAAEDLILGELIRASHQSVLKIACELLGIEPRRRTSSWGASQLDYATPLGQAGRQSQKARQRVMLGIVFAAVEERAAGTWGTWSGLGAYFALLEANGYELSEPERAKLEADKGDADAAECRICGCTDDEACEGGCSWVPDPDMEGDLCSRCLEENYAAGELVEAAAE